MEYRIAAPKDLQSIVKLNRALFEFEKPLDGSLSLDWSYSPHGLNYIQNRISQGMIVVVEDKSELLGYVSGTVYNNFAREPHSFAEIENIYILEQHRGQNIGSELINKFEKIAIEKGAATIRVGALVSNAMADKFYRKKGYAPQLTMFEKPL